MFDAFVLEHIITSFVEFKFVARLNLKNVLTLFLLSLCVPIHLRLLILFPYQAAHFLLSVLTPALFSLAAQFLHPLFHLPSGGAPHHPPPPVSPRTRLEYEPSLAFFQHARPRANQPI